MASQTLEDLLAMGSDKITYWDAMIKNDIIDFLNSKTTNVCLLDIGCGAGKWDELSSQIFRLRKSFDNLIVGLDLSKPSVMKAKKLNSNEENVNYVVADASYSPFAARSFNAILAIALLHHLSSYDAIQEVLRETKRVTKGEIPVLFVENTVDNPFKNFLIKSWKSQKSTELHLEGFTSSELLRLVERNGFEVVQIKYANLFLVYFCTVLGFFRIVLPNTLILILNRLENRLIQGGFWKYCATIHLITKIHS